MADLEIKNQIQGQSIIKSLPGLDKTGSIL